MEIFLVLLALSSLTCASRIHHDPLIRNRLPSHVRSSIDAAVERSFKRAVETHLNKDIWEMEGRENDGEPMRKVRVRRALDSWNATSGNSTDRGLFSPWASWGECSALCGGGQQVRYRTCLKGDCTKVGQFTEARKCGTYPCVSGHFVLDSISAVTRMAIPGAKMARFFSISGSRFFGYITDKRLYISKWKNTNDGFVLHQEIEVMDGISFDILNTYPRTYLVVIEKALMVFPGRFSKMYHYVPWDQKFITDNPVTIDVWEPSAVRTFDVFGTGFLGIVNYKTKQKLVAGMTKSVLACHAHTELITCPQGSIITVSHAMYGRVTNYECANGIDVWLSWFQYFATCVVPGTKEKVSLLCDGKQKCEVTADPSFFVTGSGPSCPQTNNYLRVGFTCTSISYTGNPIFYKWDGVGLSLISSTGLLTYGATDIEAFSIHDQQYIAVANHVNDQMEYHLDSEVYIYNLEMGRFQSLQKIRTDAAVDWEFFSVGEGLAKEYFLAVANHMKQLPNGLTTYKVDSIIYKWNWNLFVPFQCIETYGAKKWTALSGSTGRFTLAVTNLYGNTTFYNYDGWRFNLASVQPEDNIFKNAAALYVYQRGYDPMFLVLNGNEKSNDTQNLYATKFMKTFPKYEFLESTLRSVQKMNRSVYEDVFPKANLFNESYSAVKDEIVFVDNVTFTGAKTLTNVHVVGNTTVNSADIATVDLSSADKLRDLTMNQLGWHISSFDSVLVQANVTLREVVTKSTSQFILGLLSFNDTVTVTHLEIGSNLNIEASLNGINLSHLIGEAIFLNESFIIGVNLHFRDISIRKLQVSGSLGSVRPGDLVTIYKNESIYGKKSLSNATFSAMKMQNVEVDQLLNGVDIRRFLTTWTHQKVTSDYLFGADVSVVGEVNVTGMVNGHVFSDVVEDTVMVGSSASEISGEKAFSKLKVEDNLHMVVNATVNEVDVSEMVELGTSSSYFRRDITFASGVEFSSPVVVGGTGVNGVDITDVVFTYLASTINGQVHIKGNTQCNDVRVYGKVNNMVISDFVDTFSNQSIGSPLVLNNINFVNNVEIMGSVDGVTLSQAYPQSLLLNKTQIITGYKKFTTMSVKDLVLDHCVNDCAILQLIRDINEKCARDTSEDVQIVAEKHFSNVSVLGHIKVFGLVNDILLPGQLMLQGRNQVIDGPNSFHGDSSVKGNATLKKVNDVGIQEMYSKAMLKSEIMFGQNISFHDKVIINGNLGVSGLINGVDLKDAVKTYGHQIITGVTRFKSKISVRNFSARVLTTTGLIDGVNLTALDEDLLSMTGNKVVKGTKVFTAGVTFAGNWSIAGLIDGVNITELYENALLLDGDQTVTGKKTWTEALEVGETIAVEGLIDGVNLTQTAMHVIRKTYPPNHTQYINTNITFQHIDTKVGIDVIGSITGHNLTYVVQDTLMISGNQTVHGTHTVSNLIVSKDVNVEDTINGNDFSEEVILLNGASMITGKKTFENFSLLNIDSGYINGMNLSGFIERIAYKNDDTLISGIIQFAAGGSFRKNLTVANLINGLNITKIVENTVTKGGFQKLFSPVHIHKAVFISNVTNAGLIGLMNFTEFSNSVIYKCHGSNRNVTGTVSINNMDVIGNTHVGTLVTTGKVQGIDVVQLNKDVIRKSGMFSVTGVKRILGNLNANYLTSGKVDGFAVPSDLLTLSEDDTATGLKTFANDIFVDGDVNMSNTKAVNRVDISSVAWNLFQLDSNATVHTTVRFPNRVNINGNMEVHLLNGINISDDELLLSHSDQVVTGKKTLGKLSVVGTVHTLNNVNGFDLNRMVNESFISGLKNVMEGNLTIEGEVFIKGDVRASNLDNIANLTQTFYGFNIINSYLTIHIPTLYQSVAITRTLLSQLTSSLHTVHQSLDYFIDDGIINLPYTSKSIDVTVRWDGEVWLVAGSLYDGIGRSCTNTSIMTKSDLGAAQPTNFERKYQIVGNAITGVKLLHDGNKNLLLATSSTKRNEGCRPTLPNEELSTIYQFSEQNNTFQAYWSERTNQSTSLDSHLGESGRMCLIYTNARGCVNQTLLCKVSDKLTPVGTYNSCNTIKTIILSQQSGKVTTGILGSNPSGYRQLVVAEFQVPPTVSNSPRVRQKIATHFASDVIHLNAPGHKFLVIANTYDSSEEALAISMTVPVAVYRLEKSGSYEPYQEINIPGAIQLESLKVGIYNYLVVATYQQKIFILKHEGASKWNTKFTIPVPGYGSIKDLKTWMTNDDVYMAILTHETTNSDIPQPSKIRIMKGFLTSEAEGSRIIQRIL